LRHGLQHPSSWRLAQAVANTLQIYSQRGKVWLWDDCDDQRRRELTEDPPKQLPACA